MDVMVDWSLASTVSRGVAKLAPAGDPAPFQALEGPNAESERLVAAYTGLEPASPLPPPRPAPPAAGGGGARGVDRRQPQVDARRARAGRRQARRRQRSARRHR